jgi:hypothetical protein
VKADERERERERKKEREREREREKERRYNRSMRIDSNEETKREFSEKNR